MTNITIKQVDKILAFWFGLDVNHDGDQTEQTKLWWGKDPAIDDYIRGNFEHDLSQAMAGHYDDWLESPKSTLALVILLDQFSRHIFRGSPQAFAADPMALNCATVGLSRAYDKQLSFFERSFFYLPFEHAETIEAQERSVALFHNLFQEAPVTTRKLFEDYYIYAQQHKVIIERFGRFPHRNDILNRHTTEEEKVFLTEPNSKF